jgi:hypothetical protein
MVILNRNTDMLSARNGWQVRFIISKEHPIANLRRIRDTSAWLSGAIMALLRVGTAIWLPFHFFCRLKMQLKSGGS